MLRAASHENGWEKQVFSANSNSKGVATTVYDVVGLETDLGGEGSSKSTSLAKRECSFL